MLTGSVLVGGVVTASVGGVADASAMVQKTRRGVMEKTKFFFFLMELYREASKREDVSKSPFIAERARNNRVRRSR